MATFKAIVFNGENHVKSDGTSNIKIRIYHNKQSQYIPTEHYINPKYMSKNGEILPDFPDSDHLNFEIGSVIQNYRKIIIQLGSGKLKLMGCNDLRKHLTTFMQPNSDIIDFVKFSENVISKTNKEKTAEWYESSLAILKWFFGKELIDIKEITTASLSGLIERLKIKGPRKDKPLQPGAINNYLRGIRSLFYKCKMHYNNEDLGIILIPHDPFKRLKIPEYRRKRKNTGIEKVKQIRDGKFISERENIGRDVFMMQFYLMGININDFYNLNQPVNGRLIYERSKTVTDDYETFPLSIKVEPELQQMIDKYSSSGFLSDIKNRYSNSYNLMRAVNKGLKKICNDFGCEKITTNWARHTWASTARNGCGVAKADVDFCLGHVNNDYKMADIYIDIDYSIFDIVNRKVLDLLK